MVWKLGRPIHRTKLIDSDTAIGKTVVVRTTLTPHYNN